MYSIYPLQLHLHKSLASAKYLVPFMRKNGWFYSTGSIAGIFAWHKGYGPEAVRKDIKDDNLALAACEAFMEMEL